MNFLVLSAAKFTGLCSGSSRTQTQGPWQWLQLPLPCGSIQLGGGGDRPRPRQNQLDPPPLEEGFGAVWGIASTAVGSHPRPLTPGSCGKDNVLITLPAQLCRTSEGGLLLTDWRAGSPPGPLTVPTACWASCAHRREKSQKGACSRQPCPPPGLVQHSLQVGIE